MLDQFYWAERMHWLGVSPEPLSRNHLLPDKNDDRSVQEAAHVLSTAIHDALSSRVKALAAEIAERISHEVITILNAGNFFFFNHFFVVWITDHYLELNC